MDKDVTKIRAALEILRIPRPHAHRKHSWIKNQLHTPAGGHCILGALTHVGSNSLFNESGNRDQMAILAVVEEQYPGERYTGIAAFNDAKGRTFEEIERVLEKAAVVRTESGAKEDWTLGTPRPKV